MSSNDFCIYVSVVRMVSGYDGGASINGPNMYIYACRFQNILTPGSVIVETIPLHCILPLHEGIEPLYIFLLGCFQTDLSSTHFIITDLEIAGGSTFFGPV